MLFSLEVGGSSPGYSIDRGRQLPGGGAQLASKSQVLFANCSASIIHGMSWASSQRADPCFIFFKYHWSVIKPNDRAIHQSNCALHWLWLELVQQALANILLQQRPHWWSSRSRIERCYVAVHWCHGFSEQVTGPIAGFHWCSFRWKLWECVLPETCQIF